MGNKLIAIRWLGGKGVLLPKILPVIEDVPHRKYIEVFGGGASILLNKKPKPFECYNDLDSGLHDFFTVLSQKNLYKAFLRRVALLPVSREMYYEFCATWRDEPEIADRVAKWYFIAVQSFGGMFGSSWGFSSNSVSKEMGAMNSGWLGHLEHLPEIHDRLVRVQIEHNDFRKILDTYDSEDALFYLDPPYVSDTRKAGTYENEMKDSDHKELVQIIMNLKAHIILSGYDSDLYRPLEDAGWKKISWEVACMAAGRTRVSGLQGGNNEGRLKRVENVWVKPYTKRRVATLFG